MMVGDETYAGSPGFFRRRDAVQDLSGFAHVIPKHQGRAAERILFTVMYRPGHVVPNNTHFDTTRANIGFTGARAPRLPFKSNLDVAALERLIAGHGAEQIPLVPVTVTNNSGGGQPVSMAIQEQVRELTARHRIPFFPDACRFAGHAWFIRELEAGYADSTPNQIGRRMLSRADGCTFSARNDAFANIGGFLCTSDAGLAQQEQDLLILTEGFPA